MAFAAVAVTMGITSRTCRSWRSRRAYAQSDAAGRKELLWGLHKIGGPSAAELASAALRTEKDPHVREAAAYALQRMQARDYYEQLRDAAINEPPAEVQAKMAFYAARLGGQQAMPWLTEVSNLSRSWLALGAALGRIQLGDLSADQVVFRYLLGPNESMRAFAAVRVTAWIAVMSEAIGKPVSLPDHPSRGVTVEQANRLADWWRRHVTPRILRDNVVWEKGRDPRWHRARKLMGARGKAIQFLEIE